MKISLGVPLLLLCLYSIGCCCGVQAAILSSFYPLSSGINTKGVWSFYADVPISLRLFGSSFENTTVLTFTSSRSTCALDRHGTTTFTSVQDNIVVDATVTLPSSYNGEMQYFCLDGIHQGNSTLVTFTTYPEPDDSPLIPLGLEIFFAIVLLCLSGLFSGLNLGLMSLDTTELRIISEVGSELEQKYARTIMPLRNRGNLLLCTMLLGNVIVNSSLTVLLEGLFGSGVFAVIGSSLGIVIIGEIFPQALCSRHALWVGAHTIWIMKIFVLVTFPISYPVSLLLDRVLGEEIGAVYPRKQLLRLIQLTKENIGLGQSELNIVTGALTYREKTAGQIMTKLEDVFMVDIESKLDYRTMAKITQAGHSRIPVYRVTRENIIGLLFLRDLTFVDPNECVPLEIIINHYNHAIAEVYDDTKLDELLDFFRQGRTHICLVLKIDDTGPGDPRRIAVGVVTLEDVIEEIIQAEIYDELDEASSDPTKPKLTPFTSTSPSGNLTTAPRLSEQFSVAVMSFLGRQPLFAESLVSHNVLDLLIRQPGVLQEMHLEDLDGDEKYLYRKGVHYKHFTLVLEGRVKVTVGTDQFSFESGPFTLLALDALKGAGAGAGAAAGAAAVGGSAGGGVGTPVGPAVGGTSSSGGSGVALTTSTGNTSNAVVVVPTVPSDASNSSVTLASSSTGYIADFTAELISERALILVISRAQYTQATKASRRLGRRTSAVAIQRWVNRTDSESRGAGAGADVGGDGGDGGAAGAGVVDSSSYLSPGADTLALDSPTDQSPTQTYTFPLVGGGAGVATSGTGGVNDEASVKVDNDDGDGDGDGDGGLLSPSSGMEDVAIIDIDKPTIASTHNPAQADPNLYSTLPRASPIPKIQATTTTAATSTLTSNAATSSSSSGGAGKKKNKNKKKQQQQQQQQQQQFDDNDDDDEKVQLLSNAESKV